MAAQQILDAILEEARRDAEAIVADAEATSTASIASAREQAEAQATDIATNAETAAQDTARRDMLSAELAARKASLSGRRELLDKAFDAAVDRLCALGDKEYTALVVDLAVGAVETGSELLVVPQKHADRYAKPYNGKKTLLERINAALSGAGKKGALSLAKQAGDFGGGFRLVGEDTDIDCTFESLVASWRDGDEAEIAALLFGKKEN